MQALHGAAPDLLFAPVVYGELRALHDGGSLVSSGRLSLLYAKSGTMHGTIGDAQIRWLAGRAEICGPRLDVPASSLGACALVDAGSLEGRGSRSVAPKTRRAFWLAPGLLGRFRLVLERTLVVGIEGSVFFPLVRPTFYFAGSEAAEREVVHEVEAVGASAGLGLGVLIP